MHAQEMNLSYAPKFCILHEYVPNTLLEMNRFFDIAEDAIERWHHIHMHHYARIRALRSAERQKNSQAKYDHTHNITAMKNIITKVNKNTQRELRTKNIREQCRMRIKGKMQEEPRLQMKTHKEQAKGNYVNSYAI